MSSFIRSYDDFASRNSVSLSINLLSNGYMLYSSTSWIAWSHPALLAISLCAGAALAVFTKNYLSNQNIIRNQAERNNFYTTTALLGGYCRPDFGLISTDSWQAASQYIRNRGWGLLFNAASCSVVVGLKIGFFAAQLFMQIKEIQAETSAADAR